MAKVKVARLVLRYDVILVDHGAGKLNVIKVVKTILGLGLKEAKDLVEAAPSVLKEKIEQAEAEAIKAQLVEAGATVEVRVHGMKPPAPPPTPAPSGDTFDVFLKDAGAGKLNVVKVVKTVLGLGLKEAKDLVDSAPTLLTGNVERDYAEAIKAQLVEAGATVEVRVHGEPAPSPAPAPAPDPAPVPTGFDVVLKDSGPNKLNVVKIVKTILGLGLKEAKDLVDSAPAVLKEKISKEEAEAIKAQLVEAGATVEVR